MKRSFSVFVVGLLLGSCVSIGRMVEINDPYKESKGIKLMQNMNGRSVDESASKNGSQHYSISFVYSLETKKNEPAILSLDIQMQTSIRTDELDSVIILNLDNEKIRIISDEFKSRKYGKNTASSTNTAVPKLDEVENTKTKTTEKSRSKLMKRQFIIPENLWVSIANTEAIKYRLYIGKEGVDIKLKAAETTKLNEFFNRAMQMRDANLPPIPEGLKKL